MLRSAMDSTAIRTTVYYCCVCNGKKKLHSYNNGDYELESLAELCLENSPPFHAWYLHTMGRRTYGFLMEDGHTYFAITDSNLGNSEILHLLEHVRDGFKKAANNGLQEELVHVIKQLIESAEPVAHPTPLERTPERPSPVISTKAPLLGKAVSSKHDKKLKDRVIELRDGDMSHTDKGIRINMPPEQMEGVASLQKSSSRARGQHIAHKLWWRQVRIILAVDVILCLILFGVWLAVCNGFHCVSGR